MPELEGARGDERAQLARLEPLLEHEASLARQRAVVRQRDLLFGERVDARRHLLGLRAVVDEDERRARARGSARARAARPTSRSCRRRAARSSTGETTLRLHALDEPAVDDRRTGRKRSGSIGRRFPTSPDRAPRRHPPRKRAISSSGRCVAESPMRCGGVGREAGEPLERERQVRAALRAGHGVDLVDDDGAQRAEHRAAAHAREQDVQRLRRRDEDVRRLAQHPRARATPACRPCARRRGSRGTSRRPPRSAAFELRRAGARGCAGRRC